MTISTTAAAIIVVTIYEDVLVKIAAGCSADPERDAKAALSVAKSFLEKSGLEGASTFFSLTEAQQREATQ